MLTTLRIENFRHFHDHHALGLSGLTLLTGPPGVGKTAFLQAAFAFLTRSQPAALWSPFVQGPKTPPANPLQRLLEKGDTLSIHGALGQEEEKPFSARFDDQAGTLETNLDRGRPGDLVVVTDCNPPAITSIRRKAADGCPEVSVLGAPGTGNAHWSDDKTLEGAEADIREILGAGWSLEPRASGAPPRVLTPRGCSSLSRLPKTHKTIISALLALHAARGAVLIADDFLDHVHHSVLGLFWHVFEARRTDLEAQLLATTHNADAFRVAISTLQAIQSLEGAVCRIYTAQATAYSTTLNGQNLLDAAAYGADFG